MKVLYYIFKYTFIFILFIFCIDLFSFKTRNSYDPSSNPTERFISEGRVLPKIVVEKEEPKIENPLDETYMYYMDSNSEITLLGTSVNIKYYNQCDPKWADIAYGPKNSIGAYGCGPTTLAMLVSSFTENQITPDEMAKWSYDNGYFSKNSGSSHSIIPEGSIKWNLSVTPIDDYSTSNLIRILSTGNVIVVLMGNGHFTKNGHFIMIRGITLEGKMLIVDSASLENSTKEWEPSIIIDEAKYGAYSNGPFWAVTYKNPN